MYVWMYVCGERAVVSELCVGVCAVRSVRVCGRSGGCVCVVELSGCDL